MNQNYDVAIIGGGHNGLTTAALLAKRGKKVVLFERRKPLGGIASASEFHPGHKTLGLLQDTTAVWPSVIDTLQLERYGLKFSEKPLKFFIPQKNGPGIFMSTDPREAFSEIEKLSKKDAEAYSRYRDFFKKVSKVINPLMAEVPPDLTDLGLKTGFQLGKKALALRLMGKTDMMELLRVAPMCVADFLNDCFETSALKAGLAAPAIHGTFAGPWSPGSTANLVLWETATERNGGRYIEGGPASLTMALEKAARDHGVEIRTETEVNRILLEGKMAQGVQLAGGEKIQAHAVAASCDPSQTFLELLPPFATSQKIEHGIRNIRRRGTTYQVNLALRAPFQFACRPGLDFRFARIGEHVDELEKAFDPVKYGKIGPHPMIEMEVRSEGEGSTVSAIAHHAPYDVNGGWNEENRNALREAVIGTLEHYSPGMKANIVASEVLSPKDLETEYRLPQGHIHHGEHALDQLVTRPIADCARFETEVQGLFLCGSGSHPGGGITCGPGALGASQIMKY